MAKMRKEDAQEREDFVLDTWKRIWPRGETPLGSEHTAKHVNDLVKARYNEFMRSDKIYRLRDRAIDELRMAGNQVPDPPRKFTLDGSPISNGYKRRIPAPPKQPRQNKRRLIADRFAQAFSAARQMNEAAVPGLPVMITGLGLGEVGGVTKVLDRLRSIGAANLAVELAGDTYVVINVGK